MWYNTRNLKVGFGIISVAILNSLVTSRQGKLRFLDVLILFRFSLTFEKYAKQWSLSNGYTMYKIYEDVAVRSREAYLFK